MINSGVRVQFSLIAFFVVFGLSAAAAVFLSRVRLGWREARDEEDDDPRFVPQPS